MNGDNLWICNLNGCKADFHYPGLLHCHYQQIHAEELEGIETVAFLIPYILRASDKVIALLSHTRGRGINPKPFEAGAGQHSPLHKSPWPINGARPSRKPSTRQSTGASEDTSAEVNPSYEAVELKQKRHRLARSSGGPYADQQTNGGQHADRSRAANGRACSKQPGTAAAEAAQAAAELDAGIDDQAAGPVVPYAFPTTDVGMLANGAAAETQMSAEISAIMRAALQSGRQIDVELPTGAVMRIR